MLHEARHDCSVFRQLLRQVWLPPQAFWQDWLVVPQGLAQDDAVDRHDDAALHVPSDAASFAPSAAAAASPTGS